jgi:hypothetical protein
MSRLDELPPDQRAALAVLLRAHKSYGEVAAMLGIAESAVHDRAHAALAVLAPREARELDAASRQMIGDYLLGQRPADADRLRTRTLLAESAPANAWGRAVAAELAPEAPEGLPEIPPAPAGAASTSPAAPAAASSPGKPGGLPSSRVGGALLLAAIVAAVAVAVVLLTSNNGSGGGNKHAAAGSTTATTTGAASTGTATGGTSTGAAGQAKVVAHLTLKPTAAGSRSTGTVQILAEGSKNAFYIKAEHIPSSKGFFYAVWLYNSPTSALPLSKAPEVGASHKLEGAALLPSNAGTYREILLTQETSTKPTRPGHVVLRGPFRLSG